MGTPFKMKGHTLPGINQKAAPTKFAISGAIAGIAALAKAAAASKAGLAIAAAAKTVAGKAAIGTATTTALNEGVKAGKKPGENKRAEQADAKNKRTQASNKTTAATSGDIGAKTKLV
tara:strand:- start:72 stop:425 length:354 start_codon:yes stop_codon:yes gene_type:complete